ncbi:MAG: tail fiber domain-containing protein [Phycisphaerales bacterium]|nr:tail fiber domain-containing protein [Phycisphaerales bacterium]
MHHQLLAILTAIVLSTTAFAQSATTFTYQGHLTEAGAPADGLYEFEVRLLDNLGIQIGLTEIPIATATQGTFTMDLDFGPAAFDGSQRFLEISVRSVMDGGPFTTLSPNHPVTSTPIAQFALTGNEGPTGPQGNPGTDGAPGTDGTDGNDGAQGIQGIQGPTGNNGPQGIQGDPGIDGAPGTPGDSHWSISGSNTYYNTGNVGVGVTNPAYPIHVETAGTRAIFGEITAPSGVTYAINGQTASTLGRGVYGNATSPSGTTFGMYGRAVSPSGTGVYGFATATSGTNYGVRGLSMSSSGRGLFGSANSGTGTTYGVHGQSNSSSGRGVYGHATATSGTTYGMYGLSNSNSGRGIYGHAAATTGVNYGVFGQSDSILGRGVYGHAAATTGLTYGVLGNSNSSSGIGVSGFTPAPSGTTYGVFGQANSSSGTGVYGSAFAGTGVTYGVQGRTSSTSGRGVHGRASADTGTTFGMYAESDSTTGRGVYGHASATSGTNYGVYGQTSSSTGFAGYFVGGKNYFSGNVGISTSNPTANLHINSASGTDIFRVQKSGSTKMLINANGGISLGVYNSSVPDGDTLVAGNLTVGTNSHSTTFDLNVSGTAGKTGGGSWAVFSDQRLKKNITPMTGSLNLISALRPVNFQYKPSDHFSYTPGTQRGFIAQEVAKVIPQWVHTAKDGYLYLDQTGYEALIVDAIQELRAEKDIQVQNLQTENQKLQARLDRLEKMILILSNN